MAYIFSRLFMVIKIGGMIRILVWFETGKKGRRISTVLVVRTVRQNILKFQGYFLEIVVKSQKLWELQISPKISKLCNKRQNCFLEISYKWFFYSTHYTYQFLRFLVESYKNYILTPNLSKLTIEDINFSENSILPHSFLDS